MNRNCAQLEECYKLQLKSYFFVFISRQVLVQLAPVITEAPNDLEVNAGDRVEMFCAATGVPVPKIRWKFQNQLVPGTSTESPGKSR